MSANPSSQRMQPLPRGHNAPPPEFVARNQRERLMAALAAVLFERGYAKTTLRLVCSRAGVSQSDFYKRFDTKDDLFVATFDDAVGRMRESLLAPCASAGNIAGPRDATADKEGWAVGGVGSLSPLCAFLASEPARARLVLVEGLCAGRSIYDRYLEAVQSFVLLLRTGAPKGVGHSLPEGIEEAVVGGIVALLTQQVRVGETESIEELLPDIAEFALTPYLGVTEARRIISQRSWAAPAG